MSRLLITGSRDHQWSDYDFYALSVAVRDITERTHMLPVLVHGGASGADTQAAYHGQQLFNLPNEVHRADWNTHGRAAGPIRNKEMVNLGADLCLAFPDHPKGQGSRGTWGCIDLAHQAGIPVYVVWNRRMWIYNPSHPDHGRPYTPAH